MLKTLWGHFPYCLSSSCVFVRSDTTCPPSHGPRAQASRTGERPERGIRGLPLRCDHKLVTALSSCACLPTAARVQVRHSACLARGGPGSRDRSPSRAARSIPSTGSPRAARHGFMTPIHLGRESTSRRRVVGCGVRRWRGSSIGMPVRWHHKIRSSEIPGLAECHRTHGKREPSE